MNKLKDRIQEIITCLAQEEGDLCTFVPGGAGIGKGFPSGLNCVRGPTGGRSGELGPTPDDGILDTHCWG
jgi:hypothetical protein